MADLLEASTTNVVTARFMEYIRDINEKLPSRKARNGHILSLLVKTIESNTITAVSIRHRKYYELMCSSNDLEFLQEQQFLATYGFDNEQLFFALKTYGDIYIVVSDPRRMQQHIQPIYFSEL